MPCLLTRFQGIMFYESGPARLHGGRARVAVTSGRDEWRKRVIAYEALLHRLTGALSVRSLVVVGAWLLVGRQD